MSNKQDSERRSTDRRKDRRGVGLYNDSSDNASLQRSPEGEKVREAWRQILDRRHDDRRGSGREQHMPLDKHAVQDIEAGS